MLKLNNYSNYILKDISLEIQNKNLIILGQNGSGKTTLALSLIENIKKDTKLINYIPVGLDIFDEYIDVNEFLQLNCLYNIYTINEVLELLDIDDLKYKSCKYLSSGEAQLVLIAGAILHNATYTIFDEPTSNLDPIRVKKVYDILNDKNYFENKIIITHNLNLAYKLGYDILFLEDGNIKFQGSSETFFNNENLNIFFNNTVEKIDNNIVVKL